MLYPTELWLQGCRLIAHQSKSQNAAEGLGRKAISGGGGIRTRGTPIKRTVA